MADPSRKVCWVKPKVVPKTEAISDKSFLYEIGPQTLTCLSFPDADIALVSHTPCVGSISFLNTYLFSVVNYEKLLGDLFACSLIGDTHRQGLDYSNSAFPLLQSVLNVEAYVHKEVHYFQTPLGCASFLTLWMLSVYQRWATLCIGACACAYALCQYSVLVHPQSQWGTPPLHPAPLPTVQQGPRQEGLCSMHPSHLLAAVALAAAVAAVVPARDLHGGHDVKTKVDQRGLHQHFLHVVGKLVRLFPDVYVCCVFSCHAQQQSPAAAQNSVLPSRLTSVCACTPLAFVTQKLAIYFLDWGIDTRDWAVDQYSVPVRNPQYNL